MRSEILGVGRLVVTLLGSAVIAFAIPASAGTVSRTAPILVPQKGWRCWATASAAWEWTIGTLKPVPGQLSHDTIFAREGELVSIMKAVGCVGSKDELVGTDTCTTKWKDTIKGLKTTIPFPTLSPTTVQALVSSSYVLMYFTPVGQQVAHTVVVYKADDTTFSYMDPLEDLLQTKKNADFKLVNGAVAFTYKAPK